MGKQTKEITKGSVGFSEAPLALPTDVAWAKGGGNTGMEKYASVPRLKIVQAMTDRELKAEFGEGAVIMTPDNLLIAASPGGKDKPHGEPFVVIPLAFCTTYERRAAYGGDSAAFVLEATRDDRSALARDCRDPNRREVIGPDGKVVAKNYECINVLVEVDSGPCAGRSGVLTFSGGGWRDGRKFIDRVCRIRGGIKHYCQRVALRVSERSDDTNSWLGLDVGDPTDGVLVAPDREARLLRESDSAMALITAGMLDRAPIGTTAETDDIPV